MKKGDEGRKELKGRRMDGRKEGRKAVKNE